ncbi:MAG TPA: HU family DNA-binding protein [Acidimicrobiales bacterium]
MNRTELVESVSGKTGLDRRQSEAAVGAVTDAVIAEIRAGNKVSLFGFGTFSPTARAARMGRNPQTGAPVRIAASKGVRFAPASAFKDVLNKGGKAAGGKKAAPAKKAGASKKASAKKAPAKKTAAASKKATSAKKAAKSAKKR